MKRVESGSPWYQQPSEHFNPARVRESIKRDSISVAQYTGVISRSGIFLWYEIKWNYCSTTLLCEPNISRLDTLAIMGSIVALLQGKVLHLSLSEVKRYFNLWPEQLKFCPSFCLLPEFKVIFKKGFSRPALLSVRVKLIFSMFFEKYLVGITIIFQISDRNVQEHKVSIYINRFNC